MGYRVEYDPVTGQSGSDRGSTGRRAALTVIFAALFLLLINVCWPQGRDVLTQLLWPGDPTVTKQAAEVFTEELRWGGSFSEAAESFCREILKDANLAD